MANLVINGSNFAPITDAIGSGGLTAGNYYATGGKYGTAPFAGPRQHEDMQITFTGANGVAVLRLGSRLKLITCTLLFAGTPSEATGRYESFYTSTVEKLERYSISIPYGSTIQGCRYVSSNPMQNENQVYGKMWWVCPIMFASFSPTN